MKFRNEWRIAGGRDVPWYSGINELIILTIGGIDFLSVGVTYGDLWLTVFGFSIVIQLWEPKYKEPIEDPIEREES